MLSSPSMPKSRTQSWSESKPTEVFWCRRCWQLATRFTPSTLWPSTDTGTGIRSRERSRMQLTPRCWQTSSAPTATTTDRWQATPRKSRPSSSWPALTRAWSPRVSVSAISSAAHSGRSVSQAKLISALRKAGRERNLEARAVELQSILRQPHLEQPATLVAAYAVIVKSSVQMIRELNAQTTALEAELTKSFELHPDAELYLSLPGLGFVLGARVIGEFGDDPNRYLDPKGRQAYSGMAPITKASGMRQVVLARHARNRQLANACYLWAFASLTGSAGAHQYSRALRARGKTHTQALRAL